VTNFTREELARYNGKNGTPAYVAYKGKVYDVSGSFLWQNGRHQVLHNAGEDLTGSLEQAPHSVEMPERFAVIGRLHED
jgi:predicted heme/steroid binding protein